jgi:predicted component of type VI protein secretion system
MAHAYFVLREAGQPDRILVWDTRTLSIGRAPGNDLVIPDDEISRKHAMLEKKDDRFVVGDYRTGNGTFVNGERASQSTEIQAGDVIRVGKLELAFVIAAAHPATLGLKVEYASHLKTVGMVPKGADGDRTMLSLTDTAGGEDDEFVVEPERSSGGNAFRAGGRDELDFQVRDLDESLDQMDIGLASDELVLSDSLELAPEPPAATPTGDATRSRRPPSASTPTAAPAGPTAPARRPTSTSAPAPTPPPAAAPPRRPPPSASAPAPAATGDTTRSRRPPSASAPAPAAGADPTQRLRGLKALLDEGLITEDEYKAKRARILDEM